MKTFASQMLQHLAAKVDHKLVYKETLHSFNAIVHSDQVQRLCVWLPFAIIPFAFILSLYLLNC